MRRATALKKARTAYAVLMSGLIVKELGDPVYVIGLWADWDRHFAELARKPVPTRTSIPEWAENRLTFLTREVKRRDLDPDAALRWLDVYPEAIAEVFAA